MSYILEALKKVEQKRVQEESPGSLALLGAPSEEPQKKPFWPYPVLAALLLNAGVMIWWLGPWRAEKKAPSARPYAVQPMKLPSPILAGKNRPSRSEDKKEGLQAKKAPQIPAEVAKKEIRDIPVKGVEKKPRDVLVNLTGKPQTTTQTPAETARNEVRKAPSTVAEKSSAAIKPSAEPQPRLKKETPPNGKIFELNDLPSGLKSALPEFKVSAHVYNTDRQNRMVRVNDKILHEGEELSPGLKVEEIIPGGIIFSLQGYRFRFGF